VQPEESAQTDIGCAQWRMLSDCGFESVGLQTTTPFDGWAGRSTIVGMGLKLNETDAIDRKARK
jgi:hypothetical protein